MNNNISERQLPLYYTHPDFSQAIEGSAINYGFFTRNGGVSLTPFDSLNCGFGSTDQIENVIQNRTIAMQALGLEHENLCTAKQVHSNKVVVVDAVWDRENAPEIDAMVTNIPHVALGILTADCVPILFADPKNKVIGAAHAGWKGAIANIAQATIDAMITIGADRASIHAAIGPCIHQPSYEVDETFKDNFLDQSSENEHFFIPAKKTSHYLFDLPAYVAHSVSQCNIASIATLPHDTCANAQEFFSYRRTCLEKQVEFGRLLSAITL